MDRRSAELQLHANRRDRNFRPSRTPAQVQVLKVGRDEIAARVCLIEASDGYSSPVDYPLSLAGWHQL